MSSYVTQLSSYRPKVRTTKNEQLRGWGVNSLSEYAGTYTILGYADTIQRSLEDTLTNGICASVLRDFATIDDATGTT